MPVNRPITDADIHSVAFSKPPIGKRGYNEDEVDAFLDAVENAMRSYLEELDRLEAENERLRNVPAITHQEPAQPMQWSQTFSPAPPESSASAARLLALAEQTAEQLTAEAKAQADQTLQDAEQRAAQTLSAAERHATETTRRAEATQASYNEKIAVLREFERNYRKRLKDYIGTQYNALDVEETVE
jgi:DivIVA domain-containing protein